jgi:hypothetical protein
MPSAWCVLTRFVRIAWDSDGIAKMLLRWRHRTLRTFRAMIPTGVRLRHFEACPNGVTYIIYPKRTKYRAGQVEVFTWMMYISTSRAYMGNYINYILNTTISRSAWHVQPSFSLMNLGQLFPVRLKAIYLCTIRTGCRPDSDHFIFSFLAAFTEFPWVSA